MGVVSPFGFGAGTFWDALTHGLSAIGPIRSFDASQFPTRVAGEVPVPTIRAEWLAEQLDGFPVVWDSEGLLRDRKIAFGLIAAAEAWRSAGCAESERSAWLSIALGLEQALLEDFAPIFGDGGIQWDREPDATLPAVRFRTRVDTCAQRVRQMLGLTGPSIVHSSACAAGTLSLSHAAALIQRGSTDIVVAGGADSMVNPLGLGGMSRLGAPSPRAEPDACRPFDRRRDGLAMGEGAAMFVVENEHRAKARGARVLARICGWGSSQDAFKVTAPREDGSAAGRALARAVERAGVDIDYVNAHGTGTPLNDPAEVKAIRLALGSRADKIPVSSIKGAIGHLMAASGAIEIASCVMVFERDVLPPTAHLEERDPDCDLDVIGPHAREAEGIEHIASNSFGFGGQNASIVLGRPR